MIFTNARLIFPNGICDGLEVVVEKGKIAALREQTPLRSPRRPAAQQVHGRSKEMVDLHGNYLAPGFIDLHVHGALGHDTMEASTEAFRAICDYHASGGTTSLLPTTATAPLDRITDVLNAVRNCRSSITRIAGVHVEGPFISKAKCGAQRAVSETLMKMLYRAKGPRGICLVTDATAGAGLPDKSQFSLFGRDCVVEDGVCLLADQSALAGSASRMIDLVRTMVMEVNVPLHEAVMMATENPVRAIGLEAKGSLKVDADADLVVLSPELEVLRTFSGGQEIFSY